MDNNPQQKPLDSAWLRKSQVKPVSRKPATESEVLRMMTDVMRNPTSTEACRLRAGQHILDHHRSKVEEDQGGRIADTAAEIMQRLGLGGEEES